MAASSMLQGQIALLLQQLAGGRPYGNDQGTWLKSSLLRLRPGTVQSAAPGLPISARSDADALLRAAGDLREGSAMAEAARKGIGSIVKLLEKMRYIARKSADGTAGSGAAETYAKYAADIRSMAQNAARERTRRPERARETARDPAAGLSFTPTDSMFEALAPLSGSAALDTLPGQGTASGLASELTLMIQNMKTIENTYATLASSLASEARDMERQSRMAGKNDVEASSGSGAAPAPAPLASLLGDQGRLVNGKS